MDAIIVDIAEHWMLYSAIPFIAAFIGYVTKRVAIEMMFRPLEFRGIKGTFLGWQGVVPQHGGRMAAIATDLLTKNLLDIKDVFARIDPDRITKEIEQPLLRAVDDVAREVLEQTHPRMWERLPAVAQDLVIKQIQAQTPQIVRQVTLEMRENVHEFLDVKEMTVRRLTSDKKLLVRLIRETSRPEMAFIARSGIYFGFALGIVQAFVWAVTKQPIVMPIFGAAVGLFTDWAAIKLIFWPREPVYITRKFYFQGKFQQRRDEVAEQYGEIIARDVLTVQNLMESILSGPRSDRLMAMISRTVADAIDQQTNTARPLVNATIGPKRLAEMKRAAADKSIERLPQTVRHAEGYLTEAMDVARLVQERMAKLTPQQFEGLLRPAFRQDEWKLIVVGGIIGGFVGEMQVILMLH
ncbi:hypothetical protein BJF85_13690 [Saccharomonospora sp. CUA-673]|uniref:hypothetical protein n=1 Tax=Saccharomonospora sp. CUA-673 TaxID=1904969 RepID=UPI00095D5A93|nr:hypothetical protein [Saccharomonospora sp. CUA-673]OLT47951.1 hypothetical protein BJF85_13690 [Saccharomonospora sp. CUA-673]